MHTKFQLLACFVAWAISMNTDATVGQNAPAPQATDDSNPGDSELSRLMPESTLNRMGYFRPTDFLIAKQAVLKLSRDQVKKLTDHRSALDKKMEKLSTEFEALFEKSNNPQDANRLYEKQKSNENALIAKFSSDVEAMISKEQLAMAKRALFTEIRDVWGLDDAITFKPFVDEIQPTKEQLRASRTLKQEAFKNLKPLLIQSLKNSDKKVIQALSPEQLEKLKQDFQFKPEIRDGSLLGLAANGTMTFLNREDQDEITKRYLHRVETSGLLAGETQLGLLLGGYTSVCNYLRENKDSYDITDKQLKKINESIGEMDRQLNKLATSDDFQQLDEPDSSLSDEELIRLQTTYMDKEEALIFETDQQVMKILTPDQLNRLKAAVLKDNLDIQSLAWVISKKPFRKDLEISDQQLTKLKQLDRECKTSLKTVSNLAQEELGKEVLAVLDARQRALIKSWQLSSSANN